MPTIDFKGKEFVWNHHLAVPYRPLQADADRSVPDGDGDSPNLIIHGDNLHALKALLPRYAGRVDVVYIDPPYNTGKESWRYNDNVNSPLVREWLDSNPVNAEDMLRHDKWLALMTPRLRLLWELLGETGVILISIDDNELHNLRRLMDDLFGDANWVGTIVWKNVTDNNPTNISVEHEYIVCYAKNKEQISPVWKSSESSIKDVLVELGEQLAADYADDDELVRQYKAWFRENKAFLGKLDRYKYIDRGGIFTGSQSVHNPGREGYRYDVPHPETGRPCREPLMGYRFPPETMKQLLESGRVLFGADESKIIELKVYAHEFEDKLESVIELDGRVGTNQLKRIFGGEKVFDHPKPVELIAQLLDFVTPADGLVLDSFAGSGTTAHAVLELNKRDAGSRSFVMVECEDYADELTAERVRRVIAGVPGSDDPRLAEGLGGSFTFCTLGDPLELDDILTGENLPSFVALGGWLFHTATGSVFDEAVCSEQSGYLGSVPGLDVWLHYKPDLEWLRGPDSALTLNLAKSFAAQNEENRHLVLAATKFVPNRLLSELRVEYAPLPFALFRVSDV